MSPYLICDPFFAVNVPFSMPEAKSSDLAFFFAVPDMKLWRFVRLPLFNDSRVVWNSLSRIQTILGVHSAKKGDCISFILAQPYFLFRIVYPVGPSVTPVVFCSALGCPKGKQWSKLMRVTSDILALDSICFSKPTFSRGNKSCNCFPHVCCSTANLPLNWPGRLQQTLCTGEVKKAQT